MGLSPPMCASAVVLCCVFAAGTSNGLERAPTLAGPHGHGALGGRWVGVQEVRGGHVHRLSGAGLSYEPPHGPTDVQWELAAAFASGSGTTVLPVELLALHASHPAAWLEPFVGVGIGLELWIAPALLARPAAVVCSGARLHVARALDVVMELSAHAPLGGSAADLQAAAGLAVHLP